MRLHLSKGLLASLAVAGALVGGSFMSPANAQEQGKQGAVVTISGTALNPDGSPGAKLPVAVKAATKKPMGGSGGGEGGGNENPPDLLSQGQGKGGAKGKAEGMLKTLGKGMTDDSGKFAVKFSQDQGTGVLLEIGEPTKSNWLRRPVDHKGKDVDLGNVQLSEKVAG
jgi:hypothetical protein